MDYHREAVDRKTEGTVGVNNSDGGVVIMLMVIAVGIFLMSVL